MMIRRLMIGAALLFGATGARADSVDALLWSCDMAQNKDYCLVQQAQFRDEWPKANKGDYPSQRNVAFCLLNNCNGAVKVDAVAACAWRTVIIASDAAWDGADMIRYESDCAGVKDKGAAMAKILFKKIYNKKMPELP